MKVALVHDYINEYGGAERVLEALAELWPEAPIYTAFYRKGSLTYERLKQRKIVQSWAHHIPGFAAKLHSPLRFLAPWIWEAFDFSGYDIVISSSSWYITKGIRVPETTLHVSYIHTPPRYLYGYAVSVSWQKYWPVHLYALAVNKSLRQFDYTSAQRVDVLVANSREVQNRIKKFWRRESTIIYPPVELTGELSSSAFSKRGSYLLTGGRLVGPKHFDLAIQAANELQMPLKVFGTGPAEPALKQAAGPTVEFVGKVTEEQLAALFRGAKAFIALAEDEDFGITPVEAMMAGTPVAAYKGGGYLESVIEGVTGTFIEKLTVDEVKCGIQRIEKSKYGMEQIKEQAKKFSKERFKQEMKVLVEREWEKKRAV